MSRDNEQFDGKVYITKYAATTGMKVIEGGYFTKNNEGEREFFYNGIPGQTLEMYGRNDWTLDWKLAKKRAQDKLLAARNSAHRKLSKIADALDILNDWEG